MGLLDKMAAAAPPEPEIPAPKPVVREVPAPVQEVIPAQPVRDIQFKREPGTGLIESAIGYDSNGQRVRFDFVRDGRRSLEKIKVKR